MAWAKRSRFSAGARHNAPDGRAKAVAPRVGPRWPTENVHAGRPHSDAPLVDMPARSEVQFFNHALGVRDVVIKESEVDPLPVPADKGAANWKASEVSAQVFVYGCAERWLSSAGCSCRGPRSGSSLTDDLARAQFYARPAPILFS